MSVVERMEAGLLRTAMALPERVQRRLAGRPVVIDGQTLAVELQLMLRLQRIARVPAAETLPLTEAREAVLHHARLTGGRLPVGSVRDLSVGDRRGRLYTPSKPGRGLLVFFHGGGFMYGDLDSHDAPCRFLAERAGVRVLAVDYRMGPEHPYPAAYDDALAALEWAVDHAGSLGADPGCLGVGGDSAGGNLAAVAAIEAARRGWPLAFQLLVYPATDMARDTRSYALFQENFYLTRRFMELGTESYVPQGHDLRDPGLSPLHADLPEGVAPAYVVTAGFDPLRDEGEAYARKLEESGVDVEVRRFPDLIHGFFNIVAVGTRCPAANEEIAAHLKAALNGS